MLFSHMTRDVRKEFRVVRPQGVGVGNPLRILSRIKRDSLLKEPQHDQSQHPYQLPIQNHTRHTYTNTIQNNTHFLNGFVGSGAQS